VQDHAALARNHQEIPCGSQHVTSISGARRTHRLNSSCSTNKARKGRAMQAPMLPMAHLYLFPLGFSSVLITLPPRSLSVRHHAMALLCAARGAARKQKGRPAERGERRREHSGRKILVRLIPVSLSSLCPFACINQRERDLLRLVNYYCTVLDSTPPPTNALAIQGVREREADVHILTALLCTVHVESQTGSYSMDGRASRRWRIRPPNAGQRGFRGC
jgi:hypothetical protein